MLIPEQLNQIGVSDWEGLVPHQQFKQKMDSFKLSAVCVAWDKYINASYIWKQLEDHVISKIALVPQIPYSPKSCHDIHTNMETYDLSKSILSINLLKCTAYAFTEHDNEEKRQLENVKVTKQADAFKSLISLTVEEIQIGSRAVTSIKH